MRYFVEITTTGARHTGLIHQHNPATAQPLANLKLGPLRKNIILKTIASLCPDLWSTARRRTATAAPG